MFDKVLHMPLKSVLFRKFSTILWYAICGETDYFKDSRTVSQFPISKEIHRALNK